MATTTNHSMIMKLLRSKDLNLDVAVPILIFRHGFEDHLIYFLNYGSWKGNGCGCLWVITKLDRYIFLSFMQEMKISSCTVAMQRGIQCLQGVSKW